MVGEAMACNLQPFPIGETRLKNILFLILLTSTRGEQSTPNPLSAGAVPMPLEPSNASLQCGESTTEQTLERTAQRRDLSGHARQKALLGTAYVDITTKGKMSKAAKFTSYFTKTAAPPPPSTAESEASARYHAIADCVEEAMEKKPFAYGLGQ